MCLDHHGRVIRILRIILKALRLLKGERLPVDSVSAVYFCCDLLDSLAKRHIQVIEIMQLRRLFACVDNSLCQFHRAVSAVLPVFGQRAAYIVLCTQPADQFHFRVCIRIELIDAYHRFDAGLLHIFHMMEQILTALLQKLQVLCGIFLRKRLAGLDLRSAAVHLQGTDRGDKDRNVRLEARQAALDIPELLETDIRGEAGLRHVVIKQLQTQTVSDDGGLSDGDIRKWARVDEAWLMLDRIAERRVDGVAHPCGHGACNLQILGSDRVSLLVIGKNDLPDPLAKILQIRRDSQDRHQLGGHCDIRARPHTVAHHLAFAKADLHITKSLAAEVHDEVPLHSLRIDVQTFDSDLRKALIIVVALMLHSRVQRHHAEIVRVGDVVDISRKAKRELRHRDQERIAAAGSRSLDIHRRTAGGLAQASARIFAKLAEAFDQAQRGGRLALSQWSRRDGSHLDILAVRLVLQAVHDLDEIQLRSSSVGDDLIFQKSHFLPELLHGRKCLLRLFCDLPVFVLSRVKHVCPPVCILLPMYLKFLKVCQSVSRSSCHSEQTASLGMRRSPRGLTATEPTFGPSGTQDLLYCCEKNLQ